jgi:hypothetical protein
LDKIPTDLYEVVEVTCTAPQIHAILKGAKDKGATGIRLTGTKADLVGYLREAVDTHAIRRDEVVNLVRDHEESGDQHIFYFHPSSAETRRILADGEGIGRSILGNRVTDGSLPAYDIQKNDFCWADFRFTNGTNGGPWTAKIYGHQQRIVFRKEVAKGKQLLRYYDKVDKRLVCLAHWNGRELELRVTRAGAGGTPRDVLLSDKETPREIDRRVKKLLEFLAPAQIMQHVVPWDLRKSCRRMVRNTVEEVQKGIKKKDSKLPYHAPTVCFSDKNLGMAQFFASDEDEQLVADETRLEALQAYLKSDKAVCQKLIIFLDPNDASGIWGEQHLRVGIGGANNHEIVIASNVNPATIQYVAAKLRQYDN